MSFNCTNIGLISMAAQKLWSLHRPSWHHLESCKNMLRSWRYVSFANILLCAFLSWTYCFNIFLLIFCNRPSSSSYPYPTYLSICCVMKQVRPFFCWFLFKFLVEIVAYWLTNCDKIIKHQLRSIISFHLNQPFGCMRIADCKFLKKKN